VGHPQQPVPEIRRLHDVLIKINKTASFPGYTVHILENWDE